MGLNFELVVSDQIFSVILVAYKWFKVQRQCDIRIVVSFHEPMLDVPRNLHKWDYSTVNNLIN